MLVFVLHKFKEEFKETENMLHSHSKKAQCNSRSFYKQNREGSESQMLPFSCSSRPLCHLSNCCGADLGETQQEGGNQCTFPPFLLYSWKLLLDQRACCEWKDNTVCNYYNLSTCMEFHTTA